MKIRSDHSTWDVSLAPSYLKYFAHSIQHKIFYSAHPVSKYFADSIRLSATSPEVVRVVVCSSHPTSDPSLILSRCFILLTFLTFRLQPAAGLVPSLYLLALALEAHVVEINNKLSRTFACRTCPLPTSASRVRQLKSHQD